MKLVGSDPEWVTRGKTIRQLIKELQTFENQDQKVEISIDGGDSHYPISILGNLDGCCILMFEGNL